MAVAAVQSPLVTVAATRSASPAADRVEPVGRGPPASLLRAQPGAGLVQRLLLSLLGIDVGEVVVGPSGQGPGQQFMLGTGLAHLGLQPGHLRQQQLQPTRPGGALQAVQLGQALRPASRPVSAPCNSRTRCFRQAALQPSTNTRSEVASACQPTRATCRAMRWCTTQDGPFPSAPARSAHTRTPPSGSGTASRRA
ncbi:MAG TPA: hypothetical protein VM347_33915 [Nonomuraea sp.]|nr:hypothetical protein [Nonomuraea sp.]